VELILEGSTSPQDVADRLSDSLKHMDDVGLVEVEALGQLDIYPGAKE
jgi:hypothetical protein